MAPNPSSLPYPARWEGWRLAARILAYGGMLVLCAFTLYAVVIKAGASNPSFVIPALIAFATFCIFQLARLMRPEAIFYENRVEKIGLLRSPVLHRTNIEGVGNVVQTRYGSYFNIVSASPDEQSIQLSGSLKSDPIVAEWLRGAPDPQAEAVKADRARVLADPRYGATETERSERLARAKQLAVVFNIVCVAFAAWLGYFAELNAVTLLEAVAPAALGALAVRTFDGLVIWYDRRSVRPGIVGCLVSAGAVAARAGLTTHLLSNGSLPLLALLAGIGVAVITRTRLRRSSSPLRTSFFIGLLGGLSAYGFIVAMDVALDGSSPRTFVSTVTDAHIQGGRSTTYFLDLAAWADQPPGEVAVLQSLYDSAPVGTSVCVNRRSGAFSLAWFDIVLCPVGRSTSRVQPNSTVTNPDWISMPTGQDLADLYPAKAQKLEKAGFASVHCSV